MLQHTGNKKVNMVLYVVNTNESRTGEPENMLKTEKLIKLSE